MAEEMKLYAVPASWPQPEYALGELVYLRGYSEPVPVLGLYYTLEEYEGGQAVWLYDAGGYRQLAEELSREPWPKPSAPTPEYAASDDFDPFLDSDDLP